MQCHDAPYLFCGNDFGILDAAPVQSPYAGMQNARSRRYLNNKLRTAKLIVGWGWPLAT